MAIFTLLDPLFCEEDDQWDEEEEEQQQQQQSLERESGFLFDTLRWEDDEELLTLLSKERETQIDSDPERSIERRSAVDWMIRVNSCYGFSVSTAILAVDYMDRFVSRVEVERERPWMMQLVAVTCLSLAAKVEETKVPLLLDFQVEGAKYVFEAKTIQRMELLVLSSLEWKMHPVTPVSFIHRIITTLGLKSYLHWEFLRQCETILLYVLPDSRFVGYLPSVLATATMIRVIEQIEAPCNHTDYQNRLLCVLKLTWEKVKDCYQLMVDLLNTSHNLHRNKRKYDQISTFLRSSSADITNDPNEMWSNNSLVNSSFSSSTSSGVDPQQKKICVPSLSRVFVDVLQSP